jgi:hypothetical protein
MPFRGQKYVGKCIENHVYYDCRLWATKRDLDTFKVWAKCLGFKHEDGLQAMRKVLWGISHGEVVCIRVKDDEEIAQLMKVMRSARKTYLLLHRPFAKPLLRVIRALGTWKGIRRVVARPYAPEEVCTNGAPETRPRTRVLR